MDDVVISVLDRDVRAVIIDDDIAGKPVRGIDVCSYGILIIYGRSRQPDAKGAKDETHKAGADRKSVV